MTTRPAFVRAAGLLLALSLVRVPGVAAQDLAIRGATILTITNGTIENGTVLVRNGKIAAVGADVAVPSGVQVIDGKGMYVMPGIIDAHSHMAMDQGTNEGSDAVTPEVVVQVHPDDMTIYRALAGGVTAANVLHGSANVIGGQSAVIKMRWGQPMDSLYWDGAQRIVKFALGENPKRSNFSVPGGDRRFPATRMGVEQVLRYWFTQAQKYRKEWQDYEQASKKNKSLVPPRRDLRLQALVDIMDGKLKVHAHSYRADEILMLMRVAEDFGFRINTFQHVLEGYKVADELAKHGAMASTFADSWAYKMEAYDAIPYNMAIMSAHGVVVSVNSDSDERVRRLYQEAAMGMKYGGMSENEALKMITLNPAKQLGVESRAGSIEVGKDADLAVFNGHPFAPASRVEKTIIDGRIYFDRDKAMTLEKLIAEKKAVTTTDQPETHEQGGDR